MKAIYGFLALLQALLGAAGAAAQSNYPDRPVRILVGFTPGVAPEITARLLADKFTEAWGKAVVVENITGAGGNIATDRVAKSAPDGYTLLMAGNASIIVNPSIYPKLPFDPVKDFAPITQIFIAANVLAVPDLRKRLEELGLDVIGSSPAEFAALIKVELPQWAKVIKDAGIKPTE